MALMAGRAVTTMTTTNQNTSIFGITIFVFHLQWPRCEAETTFVILDRVVEFGVRNILYVNSYFATLFQSRKLANGLQPYNSAVLSALRV
jgi:hypothetical protein